VKLAVLILLLLVGCSKPVYVPESMRPQYVRIGYLHPERLPSTLRIHDTRIRMRQYADDMWPLMDVFIVPRPVYEELERRAGVKLWNPD